MPEDTVANIALSVVLGGREIEELKRHRAMEPTDVCIVIYICGDKETAAGLTSEVAYVPPDQMHRLLGWSHTGGDAIPIEAFDSDYIPIELQEEGDNLARFREWLDSLGFGNPPAGAIRVVGNVSIDDTTSRYD